MLSLSLSPRCVASQGSDAPRGLPAPLISAPRCLLGATRSDPRRSRSSLTCTLKLTFNGMPKRPLARPRQRHATSWAVAQREVCGGSCRKTLPDCSRMRLESEACSILGLFLSLGICARPDRRPAKANSPRPRNEDMQTCCVARIRGPRMSSSLAPAFQYVPWRHSYWNH